MKIKKTSSEISAKILLELEEGPKTITEIKDKLGSNWQTVEKFLTQLQEDGEVKEMISTDKRRVYQKNFGDTYFDVPISSEERKKFNTLYNMILERYKLKKRIPTKTEFAKVAIDVITDSEELKDLPTIWYLYGMLPLKAAEPSQEYVKEFSFEHEKKIQNRIDDSIQDKENKSSTQIQREQHKKYNEWFYIYCDNFTDETKDSLNEEKILETLNKLYVACPIDDEFPLFEFFDEFNTTIRKLYYTNNNSLQDFKREIILTFDSLWKYYATYRAYKSLKELNRFDPQDIKLFYIGNLLESREITFKECFSDLHSIYLNNLKEDKKLEISDDIKEIRNIMEDFMG
jgi:predicted transcriptional regulator